MAIGYKKAPKPGRDQLDLSKRVTRGGRVINTADEERRGRRRGRGLPILFVAIFSTCFAFLYSAFYVDTMALLTVFENPATNQIFFGPGYGTILGDPLIDQTLTVLLRGFMFMVLFGISPALTWVASKVSDTTGSSFYYRNWIILSLAAFLLALMHTLVIPFMADIFGVFTLETE